MTATEEQHVAEPIAIIGMGGSLSKFDACDFVVNLP